MEPAPVPSQACLCEDNKQNSGSEKKVIWLEEPTLIHELLYVAMSTVADPQRPHIAVSNSVDRKTRNVAYEEIL